MCLVNPVLLKHKRWLENFKLEMKQKKEEEDSKDQRERERFEKVDFFFIYFLEN